MSNKFLKYFSIFMCEAFFVCLFLPIKMTILQVDVLGMNVFFIPLMGGNLPASFGISLFMGILPIFTLFCFLAKKPPAVTLYISFVLFFLLGALFAVSLLLGFGEGFGLAVCAVESAILCILNVVKIFSDESDEDEALQNEKIINDFIENQKANDVKRPQNAVKTEKCPFCGKVLYGGEQCECLSYSAAKK